MGFLNFCAELLWATVRLIGSKKGERTVRFAFLLRMLVIVLTAASWLGCGGGGGVDNDQPPPPPPPTLQSVSISPIGPAVTVGGTVQITVTGHYSDGSTQDLTASSTWTASSPLVSVSNSGLVTGVAAGVGSLTVSYSTAFSETMAVNVTTMTLNNSILQGNYVFTYTGGNPARPELVVGTFFADGQGKITGGQMDSNSLSGVVTTAIPTGSYTVFPDGRGTLILQPALPLSGRTYRFVISEDGTAGRLMAFDLPLAMGTLEKQSASLSLGSFKGSYAFYLGGVTSMNPPNIHMGLVGKLVADGVGNITSGQTHINDSGTVDNGTGAAIPFTGTYSEPTAAGRGIVILDAGQGQTLNFAFYLVSPTKAYLLETDTTTTMQALLGCAELQTGAPFSINSADGGYVFVSQNGGIAGEFAIGGQIMLIGATGNIQGGVQVETAGSGPRAEGAVLSGGYSIAPDGEISPLTWNLDPGGPRTFLGYMVSPTRMFLLQTAPQGWVSVGTAERQMAGPFDLASLQGTFGFSTGYLAGGAEGETTLGQFIADGAGNLTGIGDVNEGILGYGTGMMSATYAFPSDHVAFGQGMAQVGGQEFFFYVISPTKLVLFSDSNPGGIGVAEAQ